MLHFYAASAYILNKLWPKTNGEHIADNILKWIFLNTSIPISLEVAYLDPTNNESAVIRVIACQEIFY